MDDLATLRVDQAEALIGITTFFSDSAAHAEEDQRSAAAREAFFA